MICWSIVLSLSGFAQIVMQLRHDKMQEKDYRRPSKTNAKTACNEAALTASAFQ
jgi:hypothetical protein